MIERLKTILFGLLASVFLVACSSDPQKPLPEPTFVHQPQLNLNVASLDVVSTYAASKRPPHVESEFPTPPEETLKRWARERLRAVGRAESARYTVTNAAVTREPLQTTDGLAGAFKKEPFERYTATVEAQLEIFNADGRRVQLVSARATRSRGLLEGTKPKERERTLAELIDALMKDFDREMEKAIRQHANPWLL